LERTSRCTKRLGTVAPGVCTKEKKTDPVIAGFFQNLGEPEVVPEVRIGPFLFTTGESNAVKV